MPAVKPTPCPAPGPDGFVARPKESPAGAACLADLEWAEKEDVERAKREPVRSKLAPPHSTAPRQFISWIGELVADETPSRVEEGRGFRVETTLDPWLQDLAEHAVAEQLDALRSQYPKLRQAGLSAALVALDARTGAVKAGAPNHSPLFMIGEKHLKTGVKALVNVALEYLRAPPGR